MTLRPTLSSEALQVPGYLYLLGFPCGYGYVNKSSQGKQGPGFKKGKLVCGNAVLTNGVSLVPYHSVKTL